MAEEFSDDDYEEDFVNPTDLLRNAGGPKYTSSSAAGADEGDEIASSSELSSSDLPSHSYQVIPDVAKFVTNLYANLRAQSVNDIHYLYENHYNRITEKFFKQSTWPPVEAIRGVPNPENPSKALFNPERDTLFFILYKELYYRHIYAKLQPTLDQRFESWRNYRDLFDYLLAVNSGADVQLHLPNQWIWDIVDEFVYQFQSFSQYRSKLKNKANDELLLLQGHPEVWNVTTVLATLSALIAKSKTIQTLEIEKRGEIVAIAKPGEPVIDFENHALYRMLGYFALVSSLRIHCLLGDYYLALKTLEPLDITKRGLHHKVTACHISLFYYVGFSYLMMRRYSDAIRTFSAILQHINKTRLYHTRSYQYDEIVKKHEQMYALLAITVSLCPQRIDDNVLTFLREKFSDKLTRMQRGDLASFEEVFTYACPKFILPAPPNYLDDPLINYNQDALRLQQKLFLNEVRQQVDVTTIRSYLKLYTTITTSKLSNLLTSEDRACDESEIRTMLLTYKHKTRNLVWNGGSPLSGKWSQTSDVDFYLDKDMVHIIDTKVSRRYGDYFVRHIAKFDAIIRDLNAPLR